MLMTTSWALAALTYFFSLAQASPSPRSVTTTASSSPTCPSPISIQNGGFESGALGPWEHGSLSDPKVKETIISPGYQSSHALRLDVPAANNATSGYLALWSIEQETTGKECYGYYYNISYAYNWANYTGPEGGNGATVCRLYVLTGYTDNEDHYQYGSRTPGWHTYSYVARDVYSHCTDLASVYSANVDCFGPDGASIPGFTVLIDGLKIEALNKDHTKPPPPAC